MLNLFHVMQFPYVKHAQQWDTDLRDRLYILSCREHALLDTEIDRNSAEALSNHVRCHFSRKRCERISPEFVRLDRTALGELCIFPMSSRTRGSQPQVF